MDAKNRFFTPGTYNLTRLEYLFMLMLLLILVFQNFNAINWWIFILMIVITDGIGYVLGAVVHRRKSDRGHIAPIYYFLYNAMHNVFLVAGVMAIWWFFFGWDWTVLAMPIHLCIDRGIFGNFFKPLRGVSFEPEVHSAFAEFEKKFVADQQYTYKEVSS